MRAWTWHPARASRRSSRRARCDCARPIRSPRGCVRCTRSSARSSTSCGPSAPTAHVAAGRLIVQLRPRSRGSLPSGPSIRMGSLYKPTVLLAVPTAAKIRVEGGASVASWVAGTRRYHGVVVEGPRHERPELPSRPGGRTGLMERGSGAGDRLGAGSNPWRDAGSPTARRRPSVNRQGLSAARTDGWQPNSRDRSPSIWRPSTIPWWLPEGPRAIAGPPSATSSCWPGSWAGRTSGMSTGLTWSAGLPRLSAER